MKALYRTAAMGALAVMISGCYLSDDEGGRTRREMNEEFESSTGGERGGAPGECTAATDPGCGEQEELTHCGPGYPDCPEGQRCVDDPAQACTFEEDPTCAGVCE